MWQYSTVGFAAVLFHMVHSFRISHFLPQKIKCRGNYMKIHFGSVFPLQCFCQGWQHFILRASVFTSATLAKTSTRSTLVRLLSLLHISPRIRSIIVKLLLYNFCCTNIIIYNAMCSFLTSKIALKIILNALFEFKSKDKYERKMLNILKRNFKRKIYIYSFCLMSQVLFFFGASRWTNGI